MVIATVSAAIGQWFSTVMVGIMILLSVGLSNVLDLRSSRAVDDLVKRVKPRALVLRDGAEAEVATAELVPGDVVVLRAGAVVAADLRLIAAHDFFVSESALTGESLPVEKTASPAPEGTSAALGLGNSSPRNRPRSSCWRRALWCCRTACSIFFGCSGYLDPTATPAQREYLASLFQTGWFVESVLTQTLIVHIIRTRRVPFLQSRASTDMILTTLVIIAIGG